LKLDSAGGVTWQKTYGGTDGDGARSVQQTADGGYIVAGYTHSPVTTEGRDFWVLKLNSTGDVTWQKRYDETDVDDASSVQQTSDGGYIVAGATGIPQDVWVLKLNSTGNVTWQKRYMGGTGSDWAGSIQQTSDGGYIVAGVTATGMQASKVWVLKLSSSGGVTWQKTYGGSFVNQATSIRQTSDGGYIVAAITNSFGAGGIDVWVLKLDSAGGVTWQKTCGGTDWDGAESVQQTSDGGYIVAGGTFSFGAGHEDVWILKLGVGGDIVWDLGSGASTQTTGVTSSDSNATIITTTGDGVSSSAAVEDTSVTPGDTDATVKVQSSYGTGQEFPLTIIVVVVAAVAVVVVVSVVVLMKRRK
jgi:hypothetical protein